MGHLCKHSSVAFLVWGKKKAPFLFWMGFQLFTEIQTEWRRRCKTEDEAWKGQWNGLSETEGPVDYLITQALNSRSFLAHGVV